MSYAVKMDSSSQRKDLLTKIRAFKYQLKLRKSR